jgi:hypothetical protein
LYEEAVNPESAKDSVRYLKPEISSPERADKWPVNNQH